SSRRCRRSSPSTSRTAPRTSARCNTCRRRSPRSCPTTTRTGISSRTRCGGRRTGRASRRSGRNGSCRRARSVDAMGSNRPENLEAEVRPDGLEKRFGDVVAVHDVTATIGAGAFLTLLGASGSGKTTTLMMIAGFLEPTRGEIYVGDRRITHLPPQHRDLGLVFQNYAIFPHLSVFENIAFPLRARRARAAEVPRRVGEMLELIRLPGFETRMPSQLSGGQQQRVALARALIFGPRVLLMDEPLSALDKNLRAQMQVEIKRIQ